MAEENKGFVRVWQEADFKQIKEHLLILGQLSASCANCQEIGISYNETKNCPKCNTEFKYLCFNQGWDFNRIRRLREKRKDLILIEYEDIKKLFAKDKAKNIFKI